MPPRDALTECANRARLKIDDLAAKKSQCIESQRDSELIRDSKQYPSFA
jgi:hypothetical protein